MTEPVSVVIPYSPEHTPSDMLEEAKASVAEQTVPTRLIIIHDSNQQGPAWARNKGLEQADTRYVAFLDADDLWVADKLERQLHRLNATNAGICVDGPSMDTDQFIFELFIGNLRALMPSVVIDTAQLDTPFDEDLIRWEDNLFILECASQAGVCFSNQTFIRRRHTKSMSASTILNPNDTVEQGFRYLEQVQNRVPEARQYADIFYLRLYAELVVYNILHGHPITTLQSARHLLTSVLHLNLSAEFSWMIYYMIRRLKFRFNYK